MQYSGLFDPPLKQMSPVVPDKFPFAVVPSETHSDVVFVSLKIRRKCVDCTTVLILIAGAAAPAPVNAIDTPAPALVDAVDDDAIAMPAPVVSALAVMLIACPVVIAATTIDAAIPVVRADAVISTCVPASDAVELRFIKIPAVVPVSIEVELRFKSVPPDAMTDVVCTTLIALPVVSALRVTKRPEPVVRPEPVNAAKLPVVAITPDDVTVRPLPVVRPFAVMTATEPVVADEAVTANTPTVPVYVPVESTCKVMPSVEPADVIFAAIPAEVWFVPPPVTRSAVPVVRPVPLIRTRPVEVVAVFAVTANTSPVVVIVPVETRFNT